MFTQDARALAGGGAGGNDVVEDGHGGALEVGAAIAEGPGNVLASLAGAQTNLAGGRADAFEASRGRWEAEALDEELGLVEASAAVPAAVKRNGVDGSGGESLDDRTEGLGHVGGEVADARELEPVNDAASGTLHLEGGAGAVEITPAAAVPAAPIVLAPHTAATAAAGTARGDEPAGAVFAQVLAKGGAGNAARGVQQVEGAGEERGHGRAG